ncbi:MAG: ribosome recycling factor [Candidatus Falkowbacteria bacterium]
MNKYIIDHQEAFTKTLDFFHKDIATLRTGRANPAILDSVQVEAYGTWNPLNALGNISVSDASSLIIAPWDKSVAKDIEKAIVAADLGLSVVNEGDKLRLSVPQLTEENRKELVKKLNVKMEAARVELRQVRDQVKNIIEAAFADKEVSEDDKFRFLKELEDVVSKKNDEIKEMRDKKEKDIMTI